MIDRPEPSSLNSWHRPGLVSCLLGCSLALVSNLALGAGWRSVKPQEYIEDQIITVSGQEHTYYVLDGEKPTVLSVRGPRQVKIITRYLFAPADPPELKYRVRVLVDGSEVLRKRFTAAVKAGVSSGDAAGAVAALRKCLVDIGTGTHTLQVFCEPEGSGRIAARFYRESKRQKTIDVAFAPEVYDAAYQLQFASGSQSLYYHFGADAPLAFSVTGPTTLKVYTRLDFDHTMNGSQSYTIEVYCDGQLQRSYHYHTQKLNSALYLERADILPGSRKSMRIPVAKGTHRYEIRCVRPENCGIAAQIRIPRVDISAGPN
jgi:hypothetical protein